ncbi:MAG: hypothetical protein IT331_16065 [Anaerolineae bacterium]|nr:hypothetical protein [Anaerolineae bacterium]
MIIDTHLDPVWNGLQYNRDLLLHARILRVQEKNTRGGGRGQNTVSAPEMRRGRVALTNL